MSASLLTPDTLMVERSGSILFGEVAEHLVTLEIACNRCDRKGRMAVERMMAEHGAMRTIPTLLALLSADYPRRQAHKIHDVCGAHFPQLPAVFLTKPAGRGGKEAPVASETGATSFLNVRC
jgi:hypothetical protein